MPKPEIANQIQNETNSEHRLRVAIAATLVGASALTLAGYELGGGNGSSDRLADAAHAGSYIADGGEKSSDLNHDPRFRATSIEMLRDNGFMIGSATLVKSGNSYKLATVEHVARPLLNMKSLIHEAGPHIVESGKTQNAEFNIPGVGVFKLPSAVSFEGKAQKDDSGSIDRYALFDLPSDEEQAVEKAVEAGTLAVPEKAPFQAKYGDEFFMPLADTGKNMPFVFLGESNADKPMLTPLFLLDQGLNYQKGMETFNTEVAQLEAEFKAQGAPNALLAARQQVLTQKQDAIWQQYNSDPAEASKWLPCMGDSGSGILDSQGNVVGVLSSGEPFYDPSGKDELSQYRVSRVEADGTADASRFCLSQIVLATGS